MPRRARLRLAGVPMHVIQRGNNRSACFHSPDDRSVYLRDLRQLSERFACAVHAYVLMTNHVHLLLTPAAADGASLLMKHLGQRYVQYVNRTYARTGTLWEGRFRSCLAQSEEYVLACYRYIELNPVRAGMVAHPRDHPWSSYRFNAEGARGAWPVPHAEYLRLGGDPVARAAAYRGLVEGRLAPEFVTEIRDATNGNVVLGSRRFADEVATALGRRAARGRPGRRPAAPR